MACASPSTRPESATFRPAGVRMGNGHGDVMSRPEFVADTATALARILERCPAAIVAAAPLGLGKPNRLLNALYRTVRDEPSRSLALYTALSLARPAPKPGLEA